MEIFMIVSSLVMGWLGLSILALIAGFISYAAVVKLQHAGSEFYWTCSWAAYKAKNKKAAKTFLRKAIEDMQ